MEFLNILSRYPFLRPTLALLLGMWLGQYISSYDLIFWSLFVLLFISGIANKKFSIYKYRWIFGFSWLFFVVLIGVIISPKNQPLPYHLPSKEYSILGVVEKQITTSKGDSRMVILVKSSIPNDSIWIDKRLTVTVSDINNVKRVGMLVAFKSTIYPIFPLNNPGSFDYNNYLLSQGIYGSSRVNEVKMVDCKTIHLSYYKLFASTINSWLKESLLQMGFKGDELGVLLAMLDGDRELLTPDVKKNYQQTGTIHILAVSGLHVGIIVEMLLFMFGWLDRLKLKSVKVAIILVLIWLYAIVANLEPSIIRATLMFSILLFSRESGRSARLENSLFLSAFIILLIMPNSVNNAGFWLSYLAVGSIILFSKRIGDLFVSENIVLNKIGQLVSVTLAAQIATMPYIFYLFGTFSTYFLISNLLILPIVPLIMFGGVGISLLSLFITPFPILVDVVSSVVFYMNWVVDVIQQLPYSQIDVGHLSFIEMLLWYSLLVLFLLWISSRKAIYIFSFQVSSILLLLIMAGRTIFLQSTNEMVVFAHSDMLIASKNGDKMQIVLLKDNSKSGYLIEPYSKLWPQGYLKYDTLEYKGGVQCISSGSAFGIVVDDESVVNQVDTWRFKPQFIYVTHRNRVMVLDAIQPSSHLTQNGYSNWPLMRRGAFIY